MKKILLAAALTILSSPAFADVILENVRAFETSEGMKNGAVLLDIMNHGKDSDKLISATTPAADKVEIHEMKEENGVMKMREVGGVKVDAGTTVSLNPNGYHIMLLGLKEPLKAGSAHPLTLHFQKAGDMKTTFEVVSRTAKAANHDHSSHEGHH